MAMYDPVPRFMSFQLDPIDTRDHIYIYIYISTLSRRSRDTRDLHTYRPRPR